MGIPCTGAVGVLDLHHKPIVVISRCEDHLAPRRGADDGAKRRAKVNSRVRLAMTHAEA